MLTHRLRRWSSIPCLLLAVRPLAPESIFLLRQSISQGHISPKTAYSNACVVSKFVTCHGICQCEPGASRVSKLITDVNTPEVNHT